MQENLTPQMKEVQNQFQRKSLAKFHYCRENYKDLADIFKHITVTDNKTPHVKK